MDGAGVTQGDASTVRRYADPMTTTAGSRLSRTLFLLADGVRVLGVASILASALWLGGVEVALFALVLLGLVLPRVLHTPPGVDLATGVTLLAAGWIAVLGLFEVVGPLDLVMHWAANGLLAVVAYSLLVRLQVVPALGAPAPAHARAGVVVVTTAVGVTLGLLWELGEWAGHTYLDDTINVGYTDTLGDLVAGGLGSVLGGLALAARRPAPATGPEP